MENNFGQNYRNSFFHNQLNQSPCKENRINQFDLYNNKDNNNPTQNSYYNGYSYFSTPKKGINLNEPDNLLSPFGSNTKNNLNNNNMLNQQHFLSHLVTPFKSIGNNSPISAIKYENKR